MAGNSALHEKGRRLRPSVVRIAPTPEPSLSAIADDPLPSFSFGVEASNFFEMPAWPDGLYVPFVPDLNGVGIDCDALARVGHVRQYEPAPYRVNGPGWSCRRSSLSSKPRLLHAIEQRRRDQNSAG